MAPLDPSSALAADEIQMLGDALVGAGSAAVENGVAGGRLGQVGVSFENGKLTLSFDLSWPCEEGLVDIVGTTTATLDFQSGRIDGASEAVVVPRDCRVTHSPLGRDITMSGDPEVRISGDVVLGPAGGGEMSGKMTGAVLWKARDGRAGRCEVDLTVDWTSVQSTQTVTGTFCGSDYEWQQ